LLGAAQASGRRAAVPPPPLQRGQRSARTATDNGNKADRRAVSNPNALHAGAATIVRRGKERR